MEPDPMHASPSRPVVINGQPDPLFLATQEAEDEAIKARRALDRARRQRLEADRLVAEAEERHHQAVARASLARCKWVTQGKRQ